MRHQNGVERNQPRLGSGRRRTALASAACAVLTGGLLALGVAAPAHASSSGNGESLRQTGSTAVATSSAARPHAARCSVHANTFRRSKGAAKQQALRRFRVCQKQNQNNRLVFKQLRQSRLLGERANGDTVDLTLCAKGAYLSRVSSPYSSGTAVSDGTAWMVTNARVARGGKIFTAIIKGQNGWETAIAKRGPQWQVGVASLGRVMELGNADRTQPDPETCR